MSEETKKENPYVELARRVVEKYVREGSKPDLDDVPDVLKKERAGVFVSLKKGGELRGCIGTVEPVYPNVAEEIASNAISSATRDPRFPPVSSRELEEISYSVDVLEVPEEIENLEKLDPRIYGVIVSSGGRVGVLLPDLEGIDTPEEQVRIAMMKAGIRPGEPVKLRRFRVRRYK